MDYYFPDLRKYGYSAKGKGYLIFWGFFIVLVVNRDGEVVRELHSRIRS